ncbi:hypothetical protein BGX24_011142 [Mortierella sp. AD032]|nr:hypothetical protein BGX24_011142 [Mortierella sp. AD032]
MDHEHDVTSAHILLTAYDRVLYDHAVDLTKVAPFIPRFQGKFALQETFPAPALLPAQLPKQLFSFPAVEALASIQLYDTNGSPILCTSVPLTNIVSAQSPVITIASVSLAAASVALAAITGLLAFLSSAAVLTTMPLATAGGTGTVGSSGGLSPSVADVVSFCQFIAMSGSLTLEYPELLQQWTQNFGWSMGLVHSEGWNEAINSLRTRTSKTEAAAAAAAKSEASKTSADKVLFNGKVSSNVQGAKAMATTTAGAATAGDPNALVKVLSMQSMMGGTVKNFVEQAIAHNQTQSQALSMAMANIDLSHLLKPVPSKRQAPAAPAAYQAPPPAVPAAPAPAPPAPPAPPVPFVAPTPTPVIGANMLPSLQDTSLMNRFGDHLSTLNVFNAPNQAVADPSPASLSAEPPAHPLSPPEFWPQGGYHPSTNALSPPGLVSYGQRLHIPAKNMFMTSLFLFLILLVATSMLALLLRIGLEAYAYFRPGKFTKLRRRFTSYYLGGMLRVVLLAYFAVATMAFYQLTLKDSWAITLLAAMTVLLFLALVTYITLRLRRAGGTSLFFDERIKSKYGALYDQYVLSAYWFFVPVLLYQMTKAAIVGLGQCSENDHEMRHHRHGTSESWAQVSLLLLVEISFAALTIWKHPFSDKTPNRLNGTLGCVRVLNVVLLAVLIEGTALSTVARTVVGVVITGTQALVMIILALLITFQLGRAIWRLWGVIKASRMGKKNKKKDLLSDEEIVVVSVKDMKDNHRKDDDQGGERLGRKANEYSRWGDDSLTGLIGMMGIGSNPTIQCTPASDDEYDGEDFGLSNRRSVDKYPVQEQEHWEEKSGAMGEVEEGEAEAGAVVKGLRESTQSYGSQSSHILDYYKSSYLPASLKADPGQNNSGSSECGLGLGSILEDEDLEFGVDRVGLFVPDADPNGPWVQSAYMTRRRSESAVCNDHLNSKMEPEDEAWGSDARSSISSLQKHRRRPASMGGERQVIDAMTIGHSGTSGYTAISLGSRLGREGTRRESLPIFRSTFIPESLLAGPPPLSTTPPPRYYSVSSAMLATPPSMSPILRSMSGQGGSSSLISPTVIQDSPVASESSAAPLLTMTAIPASESSSSVSSGTQNFEEYRFPDERQPLSLEGPSRNVAAIQRNIHPLSPFHPDYQHPDDLYNAQIPSPNETGPGYASTMSPFQRNNGIPNSSSTGGLSRRPSTAFGNVPNTPQDGTYSRREARAIAAFESSSSPKSLSSTTTPSQSSKSDKKPTSKAVAAHTRRGDAPGLKIITALKTFTPAPQIPLPILPLTPFMATLPDDLVNFPIATAGGGTGKSFNVNHNSNNNSFSTFVTMASSASSSSLNTTSFSSSSRPVAGLKRTLTAPTKLRQHRQQQEQEQTPTSIASTDGSQDSMLHTLTQQESNTFAHLQRRNSSSSVIMSANASSSGNRQRVLSTTPTVLPGANGYGYGRPLTVSGVSRRGSRGAV